jgi:hypothetical protein
MKSIAAATVAIILMLGGITGASAQSEHFKERGPYISLLLTGSEPDGPKITQSTDLGSFIPGLGLASAIGYRLLPLRVELENHTNTSAWLGGADNKIEIKALTFG